MSSPSSPSQDDLRDVPSVSMEPVGKSWGALTLAAVEALCVFTVAAARSGLVLGSAGIVVTGWAKFLHQDAFRIPALLIAIVGAAINLIILWRAQRLRNMSAASWRKRPLTGAERFRTGLVISLSVLTFVLAGFEIYLHRHFHHTLL